MATDQYSRANRKAFGVFMVLLLLELLTFAWNLANVGTQPRLIGGLVCCIIGGIATMVGFMKFREVELGKKIMLVGSSFGFLLSMICVNSFSFYAAGLTLVIVSIMYLDRKLVMEGLTLLTVAIVIVAVNKGVAGETNQGRFLIQSAG